jgi:hypothetical protein
MGVICLQNKSLTELEAQWTEPVWLTFHSALRKPKTEPSIDATKFQFIWPSGFRFEDFLEIDQSEKRIPYDDHVC